MHPVTIPFSRPARLAGTFDLCVVGGSCTGVFAALRAARLGARVALLEQSNRFGGVATLGLVGMWHTLFDTAGERQTIGGLTWETLERLDRRGAVTPFRQPAPQGIRLNTEELTLELDRLVSENPRITPFLHTQYIGAEFGDGERLRRVFAANKSGIMAIEAAAFVDASGDALLCRDAGVPLHRHPAPQPPTACCRIVSYNRLTDLHLARRIAEQRERYPDLPPGYNWGMQVPGSDVTMLAGTRVLNCDCSDADAITQAEITSRRQIYALMEMLRHDYPEVPLSLQALPAAIGIREGLHIASQRQLRGDDLLHGHDFPDAIGNGTYPVDIHSNCDDQIEFFRLNGEHTISRGGQVVSRDRWLPEGEILPFYRFTLAAMIPGKPTNLIAAGRLLDADPMAFGAIRVMVNLNQCGEAAGVAAFLALNSNTPIASLDPAVVRQTLADGGSIII